MTSEQAKKLDALYALLIPHAGWDYKVKDDPRNVVSYLRNVHALARRIDGRVADLKLEEVMERLTALEAKIDALASR
jgi:acetolactate synthase small subunit